ncbi:hypothetical protein M3J09_000184 [Ascochyta lentis]
MYQSSAAKIVIPIVAYVASGWCSYQVILMRRAVRLRFVGHRG